MNKDRENENCNESAYDSTNALDRNCCETAIWGAGAGDHGSVIRIEACFRERRELVR